MRILILILAVIRILLATLTYTLAIYSALVKADFTPLIGHVIDYNISPAIVMEGMQGDSLVKLYKTSLYVSSYDSIPCAVKVH